MGRAYDKGKKPMQGDSYEGKDTKDTCVLSCGIPKKKNGTKKVELRGGRNDIRLGRIEEAYH